MLKLQFLLKFDFFKKYLIAKFRNTNLLNCINEGFTLAEVLITLLIIGVVASLVIPALISNTQDAEFKVAGKKAFSEISNVIKQMRQDKGTLNGYIGDGGSFKPDFIKYFSAIKDCNNNGCVDCSGVGGNDSPVYKNLMGGPAAAWVGGEGQFVINDGMFINIQNSDSLYVAIAVDVNGYLKGPNVYGRDVFIFQLINDKLLPMGASDTWYPAPLNCNKTNSSSSQGFGCAVYMLQDKDY